MTAIDSTGIQALQNFADRVLDSGRKLIFCGAREQPAKRMRQAEFDRYVGQKNFCFSVADALERAKVLYPEVVKEHPAGVNWGRRSTDVGKTLIGD